MRTGFGQAVSHGCADHSSADNNRPHDPSLECISRHRMPDYEFNSRGNRKNECIFDVGLSSQVLQRIFKAPLRGHSAL
jgi:hypothetical protein